MSVDTKEVGDDRMICRDCGCRYADVDCETAIQCGRILGLGSGACPEWIEDPDGMESARVAVSLYRNTEALTAERGDQ